VPPRRQGNNDVPVPGLRNNDARRKVREEAAVGSVSAPVAKIRVVEIIHHEHVDLMRAVNNDDIVTLDEHPFMKMRHD
jgi:hypothetical protein